MSASPFARAYVATLYLVGERGESLAEAAEHMKASELLSALSNDDRQARAIVLADEITRIALALERGALS